MNNSEIYKTAILALIRREENDVTRELNEEDYLDCLYRLTQDWYWSRSTELEAEAKAKEAAPEEIRSSSEENREATDD